MNALTTEAITNTVENRTNAIFHPTSIAYIQILLTPYASALDAAQDFEGIRAWIPMVFPGDLGVNTLAQFITTNTATEDAVPLDTSKSAIIAYLVDEIVGVAVAVSTRKQSIITLPWDIQEGIRNNPELSQIFGIAQDAKTLPVSVTIGPQQFVHSLSEEFTVGLLLFSKISQVDFHITLFGAPLTTNYFVLEDGTDRPSQYTFYYENNMDHRVKVGVSEYTFSTPDFMQGFSTGALWAGVDHHNYWSELMVMEYHQDEAGETIGEWKIITF
jgi:hypothetical protein